MKNFERILDRLIGFVSVVSYVGFISIMLLIVVDVFCRYVFNDPIMGSYEITERMVFCAVFASFAYAQRQKAHVHITMLIMLFPRKLKFLCTAFTGLLSSIIAIYIAYAAYVQGRTALNSNYITGVLAIPLYPFYWVECLTMGAFFVTLFFDAVKSFCALFNDEAAKEIQEAWS